MLMKIGTVLDVPGTVVALDLCVSEERLAQVQGYVFDSPMRVVGQIANHAGAVTLEFRVTASLRVACDRCLKETVQEFSYAETHIVVRRLVSEDEDEDGSYVLAEGECIDPEEIAVTDFLLELPTKILCKEDCKGLCPVCFCNRNETDCGCMKDQTE